MCQSNRSNGGFPTRPYVVSFILTPDLDFSKFWFFWVLILLRIMKLRDHPLLSYRGLPSWPPAWAWVGLKEDKRPKGEVGILRNVSIPDLVSNRCFLTMEYDNERYMGCLFVSDPSFCSQIYSFLQKYRGSPIQEIG